ncbi:FKBP-type peptidyl-prolyl cis-trans isomerase [Streptomyces hypolithicus]
MTTDTVTPKVSGAFGERAKIGIPQARPSGKFVVSPLNAGKGAKVRQGDVVVINYTAKIWQGHSTLPDTYRQGARPLVFPVAKSAVIPALDRAVYGQQAGSRIMVVAPAAAAYGETGNAGLGVDGTDTVVFVVDIMRVIGAKSIIDGHQQPVPGDLPRINAAHAAAQITVPDRAAPERLITRMLIPGTGPAVKAGQKVVFQYSGAVWAANRGEEQATIFDSSWSHGGATSVVLGRGNAIEGWDKGLMGTKVGSRVLLIVPPGQGYGSQPQKGIPAKSTLVFVIDVLAAA